MGMYILCYTVDEDPAGTMLTATDSSEDGYNELFPQVQFVELFKSNLIEKLIGRRKKLAKE